MVLLFFRPFTTAQYSTIEFFSATQALGNVVLNNMTESLIQWRTQLEHWRTAGQHYRFTDGAWRYLAAVTDDAPLVVDLLCALHELGLGGPALELLQYRGRQNLSAAELAEWQQRLPAAPHGRVETALWQARLAANQQALLSRYPAQQALWQQLPSRLIGWQLYQSAAGHYQWSTRPVGQWRIWQPRLSDYAEESTLAVTHLQEANFVVLAGLTCGPLWPHVHKLSSHLPGGKKLSIFVIEPVEQLLAAAAAVHDLEPLLEEERCHLFCGPDALSRLQQDLLAQSDLSCTTVCVIHAPGREGLANDLNRLLGEVAAVQAERLTALQDELRQRYATRDAVYWAKRWQQPGVVLGTTSRRTTVLQYSLRDIQQALSLRGWQCHTLLEPADHLQLTGERLLRTIQMVDPQLVILLDHLRYEFKNMLHNIPVLTWIQDPLSNLLCRQAGESIGPYDWVCGYYRPRCVAEFGYPAEQFQTTPVPISTRLFHPAPLPEAVQHELQADIIYAGHRPDNFDTLAQRWREDSPPSTHRLLDQMRRLVEQYLQEGRHLTGAQARELTQRQVRAENISLSAEELERFSEFYTLALFDIGFRMETLCWVADWARRSGRIFRIYGRGWDEDQQLAPFAAGNREHGEPLRQAYRAAGLVVQPVSHGFSHQRTFEALASGTLVLARYNPPTFGGCSVAEYDQQELSDNWRHTPAYVFPHLKRVIFHNAAEFAALADKYLEQVDERRNLQQEFAAIVHQRYTYSAVMDEVIGSFRTHLLNLATPSK
ncbi:MAG: hypothetical protein HJJLKODD_02973 [Phycisphaerae bacterium]|nr:hypothetical protein [Phycisphaerae bacterium]